MLMLFGMLALNGAISLINALAVGASWAETRAIGGWARFMSWCGAIMAACGFTWCYLTVFAMIAGSSGYLQPEYVRAAMELGYVVIIFPVLGSGIAIWVESIARAWRERDLASVATAGWNTFAQVYNTYEAASSLPGVFSHLGSVFDAEDADDAKSRAIIAVLLLVLAASMAGILTTAVLIRISARSHASNMRAEYAR